MIFDVACDKRSRHPTVDGTNLKINVVMDLLPNVSRTDAHLSLANTFSDYYHIAYCDPVEPCQSIDYLESGNCAKCNLTIPEYFVRG